MLVDIHSHIIPCVDDGAKNENSAVDMLKQAEEYGTRHIIATPHFIPGMLCNKVDFIEQRCQKLQQLADENNIEIKVYSGMEVFIDNSIPDFVDKGEICTLNKSRYILLELPMVYIPLYAEEVLYNLQIKGLIPIIAHPERNKEIMSNLKILADLVYRGILIQVNASSLTGFYGRKVKKTAMKLIKTGLVHFIASDAHTCGVHSPNINKAVGIVKKTFGEKLMEELFYTNGMAVINNKYIREYS